MFKIVESVFFSIYLNGFDAKGSKRKEQIKKKFKWQQKMINLFAKLNLEIICLLKKKQL